MVIINVFIIGDVLGRISIPDTNAPNFAEMELENIKYVDFLQNIEEEKVKEIYYNSLYSEFFVADKIVSSEFSSKNMILVYFEFTPAGNIALYACVYEQKYLCFIKLAISTDFSSKYM